MTCKVMLSLTFLLAGAQMTNAQFGPQTAEWMTNGSDAQRSYSIPADAKISAEALQKPGFEFLWKKKVNNEPVQLNSLTPMVLIDRYIGYRGFRSLGFVGGSSNMIYGIDTDLNRVEWQVRLQGPVPPAGSLTCPGGLTSNIARPISAAYPVPGGAGGRRAPARSDVGSPGEGAVTIAPALAAIAAAAAAAPRPPAGPGPGVRAPVVIYAIGGDGMLHALYLSNGFEPAPPIPFVPANSGAQGLTVIGGVAYATTQNCNGGSSGVWALDIASKQVASWKPSKGAIAGSGGPAFAPDGTVYVATSAGELVALEAKTLKVKDTYTAVGQEFTSSVVVFPHNQKDLLAAATKDGIIHVLDAASLGGSNHQTPLAKAAAYSAGAFEPGALATWQDAKGVRWVLAGAAGSPAPGSGFTPGNGAITNGAVAAWKVVDQNGAVSMQAGWVSRDMISPLPPMIINGVVFGVSSGEYRSSDTKLTAAQRAQKSSPAVLYALDGTTGKVFWNSGKVITSFAHSGGLSGGASQLYLQTYDQTIYAFGYPIEH